MRRPLQVYTLLMRDICDRIGALDFGAFTSERCDIAHGSLEQGCRQRLHVNRHLYLRGDCLLPNRKSAVVEEVIKMLQKCDITRKRPKRLAGSRRHSFQASHSCHSIGVLHDVFPPAAKMLCQQMLTT
jgi:hypothetical protein